VDLDENKQLKETKKVVILSLIRIVDVFLYIMCKGGSVREVI